MDTLAYIFIPCMVLLIAPFIWVIFDIDKKQREVRKTLDEWKRQK